MQDSPCTSTTYSTTLASLRSSAKNFGVRSTGVLVTHPPGQSALEGQKAQPPREIWGQTMLRGV